MRLHQCQKFDHVHLMITESACSWVLACINLNWPPSCFHPSGAESEGSGTGEREDTEDSRPATREPEVELPQSHDTNVNHWHMMDS